MSTSRRATRIRWKVKRCRDGWLPIVLIGEERNTLRCRPTKHAAKLAARQEAERIRLTPVPAT